MLGKVFKYDVKRLGRQLLPLYAVTIIMSFVNWGAQTLAASNALFSIISGFITMVFVLLLIGTVLGTFVLCIRHFYINLLKDEGYLTNTLPVTKTSLVSSKVITSMFYGVISILVALIATGIGFAQYFNLIGVLNEFYSSGMIDIMMGMHAPGSIIYFLFIMALSYLSQLLFFFFALVLGQRQNGNRILYSFVYGAVLYCIQQALSFVMIGALILFYPNILDTFNQSNMPPTDMLQALYAATTVTSLCIIGVYWYGTVRTLDKKLNLE